ncbi:MAG: transketolase, partial [bacterium]
MGNQKSGMGQIDYQYLQTVADMSDQLIDIMLNYRQSGHPGGSRGKIHILTALFLSGIMRYDIRRPKQSLSDRFVLAAGHTVPAVYALLSILYEALRLKHMQTGDDRFTFDERLAIMPDDLLMFRRQGSKLDGHAVTTTGMISYNTGPSGHGFPASLGIAVAADHANAPFRVFALEGEGGLTPGGTHEAQNGAWAAKLGNRFILLEDFNDESIDRKVSEVIPGEPRAQWEAHGWVVKETPEGNHIPSVVKVLQELVSDESNLPRIGIFHTTKGRGYGILGHKSHGTPHPMNSPQFWETKKPFQEKYGVSFSGCDRPIDPKDTEAVRAQFEGCIDTVFSLLRRDQGLIDYIVDTLITSAAQVPKSAALTIPTDVDVWQDERLKVDNLPPELFAEPGTKAANRHALGKWGRYVNKVTNGRLISFAADLSGSLCLDRMNVDFGTYGPDNRQGTEFPSEITEFVNASMAAGIASTNFAENPFNTFCGYYAIHGTYGSFIYLGYGPMRLFSQLAQDSPIRVGKVIYLAGHSGPETADDSRTHFGIFGPGVAQLFPEGQTINLVPWEHNEVPVVLCEALQTEASIIALHLTRPPILVPDRKALGIPSHFEARKGAYVVKPYTEKRSKRGTILVQGTSTTDAIVRILPKLKNVNVKIVAAISPGLFRLQPKEYQEEVYSQTDRFNSMIITNTSKKLMQDWRGP